MRAWPRNAGGLGRTNALGVVFALLYACGPNNTVDSYRRSGLTPMANGPIAKGPILEKRIVLLEGGSSEAVVHHSENRTTNEFPVRGPPGNSIARRSLEGRVALGVGGGFELGLAGDYARRSWTSPVTRGFQSAEVGASAIWRAGPTLRTYAGSQRLFIGTVSELFLMSIPYHERVTRTKEGATSELVDRDESDDFWQLRLGLITGGEPLKPLSIGGGLLFQSYPAIINADRSLYCAAGECSSIQETPPVIEVDLIDTIFAWLTTDVGRLRLTVQGFVNVWDGGHARQAGSFGMGMAFGFPFALPKSPRRSESMNSSTR